MNIRVQLVDHNSQSLPSGMEFTLLANEQEVAKGTSDANGVVSFEFESEATEGFSLRLDRWPPAEEAIAKYLKPKE